MEEKRGFQDCFKFPWIDQQMCPWLAQYVSFFDKLQILHICSYLPKSFSSQTCSCSSCSYVISEFKPCIWKGTCHYLGICWKLQDFVLLRLFRVIEVLYIHLPTPFLAISSQPSTLYLPRLP